MSKVEGACHATPRRGGGEVKMSAIKPNTYNFRKLIEGRNCITR